jgi:hypothetical protein
MWVPFYCSDGRGNSFESRIMQDCWFCGKLGTECQAPVVGRQKPSTESLILRKQRGRRLGNLSITVRLEAR